jgi:methionyl aminopeptidase
MKILKCPTTENVVGKAIVGMVVAIEPMITWEQNIKQLKDGWTLTADGKPSAHFEHDVALIDGKPEILSTLRMYIKH